MLLLLRIIIIILYSSIVCVFGIIWCLFSPRDPRHVATFSHLLGRLSIVMGIKVELRKPTNINSYGNVIYVSNHQNNYDMITVANIVQPSTVTIGKKNLLWVPLFGQLYWLSGNLLIDRNNFTKAHKTIQEIIKEFNSKKHISFWIFPEGTRSNGRDLLQFKTGAFHAAVSAKVPIIPVVVSNTHKKIKFNRWNNGLVIVEMLTPIDTSKVQSSVISVRKLAIYCRNLMLDKLKELNNEVLYREKNGKI